MIKKVFPLLFALLLSSCSSTPHVDHSGDVETLGAAETAPSLETASKATSKLEIKTLREGKGRAIKKGQGAKVHYTGWLTNGKKFDSSKNRKEPFTFRIGAGDVIEGWDLGVVGMKVGEKRKLTIPSELAYGERDAGGGAIPANSTLVFEIELLGITK